VLGSEKSPQRRFSVASHLPPGKVALIDMQTRLVANTRILLMSVSTSEAALPHCFIVTAAFLCSAKAALDDLRLWQNALAEPPIVPAQVTRALERVAEPPARKEADQTGCGRE